MNAERWNRLCSLFETAIELPAGERSAWISEQTAGDSELRQAIGRMLDSHYGSADFLEQPALSLSARRLGPWRILHEIGRGGMGIVFLGERADGVYEQQVAIKVVPGGVHSETAVLARLEHPSIARLLDAGSTPEGFPYLVMEYVEGIALDEWVARQKPGEAQRLKVFEEICAAVQYAHQNLVLHRDLKPSNILITPAGDPKLLDFGIAKQLDLTAATTRFPAATPEYASPEQLMAEPLTTASDIYTLGLLLHTLLTGKPLRDLSDATWRDVLQRLGQDEAPMAVRGDLAQIIRKATRAQPKQRYASAAELAEETRRYASGLPVLAQPPTFAYRAGRFLARNRGKVAVAAAVAIALSVTALLAVLQARTADRRFQQVRRLANSVLYEIHDSVAGLPGSNPARLLLSERALEYLEALSGEAGSSDEIWADVASGYKRLGDVQGGSAVRNLGRYAEAETSYRKAKAIADRLLERNPNDREALKLQLRMDPPVINAALRSADRKNSLQRAEAHFARAAAFQREHPADRDAPTLRAEASFLLATAYLYNAQHDRALRQWLETERLFEALPTGGYVQQRKLVGVYQFICDGYLRRHNLARARAYSERAVAAQEKLRGRFPNLITARMDLALCQYQAASVLAAEGKYREAVAAIDRMIPIREELVREEPTDVLGKSWLAAAHTRRGEYLEGAGLYREAVRSLETGLRQYYSLIEIEKGSQRFQTAVAETEAMLAALYWKLARRSEACALYRVASDRFRDLSREAKSASASPGTAAQVESALHACGV